MFERDNFAKTTEPNVITKPLPFYRSLQFLAGASLLMLITAFGIYTAWQTASTPTQVPKEEVEQITELTGVLEAVDLNTNMIIVKSKTGIKTYQLANDVLISELNVGVKPKQLEQFSMPITVLSVADLPQKIGREVYLVLDTNGKNVSQIQLYPKLK